MPSTCGSSNVLKDNPHCYLPGEKWKPCHPNSSSLHFFSFFCTSNQETDSILFSKTIFPNQPQHYEAWTHMKEVKEEGVFEVKLSSWQKVNFLSRVCITLVPKSSQICRGVMLTVTNLCICYSFKRLIAGMFLCGCSSSTWAYCFILK